MLRITVRNHPSSGATRTLLPIWPGSYCGGQLATPAQIRSSAAPMYSYGVWETTGSCMSGRGEAGAARIPRQGTT
jgi:hypothetical protein